MRVKRALPIKSVRPAMPAGATPGGTADFVGRSARNGILWAKPVKRTSRTERTCSPKGHSVSGGLSVGQEAQADEGAGEVQKSEYRGGVPVVPDGKLAKRDDPGLRALHDPPDPSQELTRLHAPPRDPRGDPA